MPAAKKKETARERALRRAAEAAEAESLRLAGPRGEVRKVDPMLSERHPPETPKLGKLSADYAPRRVQNKYPGHRDVVRLMKKLAVVLRIEWRDPTWHVEFYWLSDKGRAISVTQGPSDEPRITYLRPSELPTSVGRWEGQLIPGARGDVRPHRQERREGPAARTKETQMTSDRRNLLLAAYLTAFDNFATDRSEIASTPEFVAAEADEKKRKALASRVLKELEAQSLVCSTDVNEESQGSGRRGAYKELTWQCWQTYDSISREEAIALFNQRFPEDSRSVRQGAKIAPATNRPKEDTMATTTKSKGGKTAVVTRKGAKTTTGKKATTSKPAAAKASTNGGSRRSHEELLALVPKIAKARREGKNWDDVKTLTGVGAIQARALLAETGHNNKGEQEAVTPITGTGAALAKKLVKARQDGAPWYRLALATGKSESEVREIVEKAGGPTGRVYTKSAESVAAEAPAAPTGKGKAVTRKKGNPSK